MIQSICRRIQAIISLAFLSYLHCFIRQQDPAFILDNVHLCFTLPTFPGVIFIHFCRYKLLVNEQMVNYTIRIEIVIRCRRRFKVERPPSKLKFTTTSLCPLCLAMKIFVFVQSFRLCFLNLFISPSPIKVAFTGATIARGPSPQPTACIMQVFLDLFKFRWSNINHTTVKIITQSNYFFCSFYRPLGIDCGTVGSVVASDTISQQI